MSENSISVIKPYKWEGLWVFDDPRVDLVREPFVAGADTMIDIALQEKGIENADSGFLLVFSATRFPGVDLELSWVKEDCGGSIAQVFCGTTSDDFRSAQSGCLTEN